MSKQKQRYKNEEFGKSADNSICKYIQLSKKMIIKGSRLK